MAEAFTVDGCTAVVDSTEALADSMVAEEWWAMDTKVGLG